MPKQTARSGRHAWTERRWASAPEDELLDATLRQVPRAVRAATSVVRKREGRPDLLAMRLALRVDPHLPGVVGRSVMDAAMAAPQAPSGEDAVRLYELAALPGDLLRRAVARWNAKERADAARFAPRVLEAVAGGHREFLGRPVDDDPATVRRAAAAFGSLIAHHASPPVPAIVTDTGSAPLAIQPALVWLWLHQLGVDLKGGEPPLGSGTYGVVYRGTYGGRPVAVKLAVPHGDRAAEEVAARETETPRRVAERVRRGELDPAVAARVTGYLAEAVLPYAAASASGVVALVMPLAVGSLWSVLSEDATDALDPPLSCAERLAIIADVALGLRAAHAVGRVACDLKPANVLLFERAAGSGRRALVARLADFGMDAKSDASGSCSGTPLYTTTRTSFRSGKSRRPTSVAWDWFVFAKIAVLTLARVANPDDVPRAMVTAGGTRGEVELRWRVPAGKGGARSVPLECGPDAVARAAVAWAVDALESGEQVDTAAGRDDGRWLPALPDELEAVIAARARDDHEPDPPGAIAELRLPLGPQPPSSPSPP